MATWMDSIARGWLMYDLTHSSFQLGLVRGVQAVPTLLLSPIAGSVADLYSRKNQIVISQTANGLLYTWMAVMIFTGAIEPWHVYVTSLGLAAVQTFQQPARVAMVADTVPQANLSNALALNAVVFNSARSAGPALAGLFIAMYGTGGSYSMQGLFYFLATVWTCMLRNVPIQQPAHGAGHAESFVRTIIEGWKFSWRTYEVRVNLLVVSLAMFLLIPFTTLLPVYARDILKAGAKGQGLLLTCMGIGALFSSVVVAAAGDRLPRGIVIIGGVGIYGVFGHALCRVHLVSAVDVFDADDRLLPRDFPCADSNRHSGLLAGGNARPHHGDLSHDPGHSGHWRDVHRRAGRMDRRALGAYRRQSSRHAADDRDLSLHA